MNSVMVAVDDQGYRAFEAFKAIACKFRIMERFLNQKSIFS
jgi:hypothetical protein